MPWLLDTNVLSEPAKPEPDERVLEWYRERSVLEFSVSVLTFGEIARGVRLLEPGKRRETLEAWLATDLPSRFRGRILGIDMDVARTWGELSADGRKSGRPVPVIDGLLLATAAVHHLTLATRNIRDCADRGIPIFDPWSS